MRITRRKLFRHIAAVAAAVAVRPALVKALPGGASGGLRLPEVVTKPLGPIRLSRNENAYGPSMKVIAAMREATLNLANRYPEAEAGALQSRIAAFHNVSVDQVVLGCGSSEILRMAVEAFVGTGEKVITAAPTFDLIGRFAERAGAEVISVPLSRNYSHDLPAMLARGDAATRLVYICNPNNSTGGLTRRQDLETFVRSLPPSTYVLIDEAYHHYVSQSGDYASFIDRRLDDNRVIVLRSFSKIHALAGLRVGYAVTAPQTARLLSSCQLPEEVNIIAAKAAVAALDDTEHLLASVKRNADDRQEFLNQANARMVRMMDSHANFVMISVSRPVVEVIEHFKKNNISLAQPISQFDKYIRVSLGTDVEMGEFWRVWDLMPMHTMM